MSMQNQGSPSPLDELRRMRDRCAEELNGHIISFEDWLNCPAIRQDIMKGNPDYTYLDLILDGGIDEVLHIAKAAFG